MCSWNKREDRRGDDRGGEGRRSEKILDLHRLKMGGHGADRPL